MFFSIVIFFTIDSFISLWIGPDKLIGNVALIFLVIILFHRITIKPLLIIKDTNGLFKETRIIAIAEAILNLTFSIILIKLFGIKGVLFATILSTLLTNFWFYPKYIYKNIFNIPPIKYYIKYLVTSLFTISIIFVSNILFDMTKINNYLWWIIYSSIYSIFIIIILFLINYFAFSSFRRLCQKIILTINDIVKRRKHNNMEEIKNA
jgi:hypothetical protein